MKRFFFYIFLTFATSISSLSDLNDKQKKTCNRLIPFWEKFIKFPESNYTLLCHIICLFEPSYKEEVESFVKKNGLLSSNQLIAHGIRSLRKEFLMRSKLKESEFTEKSENILPQEFDNVYFLPFDFFCQASLISNSILGDYAPSRVVRYLVNKKNHYVYNGFIKEDFNRQALYENSKILLSEYHCNISQEFFPEIIIKNRVPADKLIFYYPVMQSDFESINRDKLKQADIRKFFDLN